MIKPYSLSSLVALKIRFWTLFFRFADRFISPRWFLKKVPTESELSSFSGKLTLEIVSHCWRYSHLMIYNLSAYVNNPPLNIDVTVTVFYSAEDHATVKLLEYFGAISVPGITWNWQKITTAQLMRRAIGRNKAALQTQANWIWFIDCDLIFYKGCLDALNEVLQHRKDVLLFPNSENITALLDSENEVLQNTAKQGLVDIDTALFHPNKINRAVGAYQITHGDIARACGYCNNISAYQTPENHWRKTYEDRTYRWLLGSQGVPVNIPEIYRIRHKEKGRYTKGSFISKVRMAIRSVKSKFKEDK